VGWLHLEGIDIAFVSGAMPDDDVEVRGIVGRERLGQLYEFDLLLYRPSGPFTDEELDELLKAPVAISLGPDATDVVHGVLSMIEEMDTPPTKDKLLPNEKATVVSRYHARLVPTAWLLTLARTNRVFLGQTVKQIVTEVLTGYKMAESTHFDILTDGTLRDYAVQYEENDWDFVQRWLEREGMFYWFEQGESTEKLVVANANEMAEMIAAPEKIKYRASSLSSGGVETIHDWSHRRTRTAARVALVDHNYEMGEPFIKGLADADKERGFGTVFSFGENFKDDNAGAALAKLRAERLVSERALYRGRTDCPRFRPGRRFKLSGHHDDDGEYLIIAVEHRVGYPVQGKGGEPQRYFCTFEAIPVGVPYRAPRATPWPRIDGFLPGHIDSDTTGAYADIDDQGRYLVRLPFDLSGRPGSKASIRIRLSEPYSGAAYGVHYPLHKGAEVLLSHIAGDPDRPVILSTIPNPRTPSPVTSANATQSVIRTASGIHTEMEDLES